MSDLSKPKGWKLRYTLIFSLLFPATASGAGLFNDIADFSSFILSPQQNSVAATIIRTEDDFRDAAVYILQASYVLKPSLLLQAEQPYATVSTQTRFESGFGDFRFRVRVKLLSRSGFSLALLSGLRTGSGSRRIFGFASGSIDAEIGISVVDSLPSLVFLGAATGASVWRGPENLDEATAHDDYVSLSLGVMFPIRADLDLGFIGAGYLLASGASRELYAIVGSYQPSSFLRFFGSIQAEGGKQEERIHDFAAIAGIRVFY